MKASILFLALIFLILSCFAFVSSLFIEPTFAYTGGTCCEDPASTCVTDGVVLHGYYYMPWGPCPRPQ
jgi:hypothetical protein